MKKTIPFNLFGEDQEMCFTIAGLAELERVANKSIQQICQSGNAGVDFCLMALPICLKKLNRHLYEEKIEKYLDGDDGRGINDIANPIVYAIAATGILGKDLQRAALATYYPDLYPATNADEATEKNV